METFELEYHKGRWLAPLEVIEELYDTLLRLPAKGGIDYITLGSRDSDVEICCAANPKGFVKEPFAHTEAEAHIKLAAWREKSDLAVCDRGGERSEKAAASETFATSEAEAVRCLRERGYIVAPPRASGSNTGSITPPPPYALHLSSSQPADTSATSAGKRKRGDDGGDDRIDRPTARATSCPSTPIRGCDNDNGNDSMPARTRGADGGPEVGDSDADDDDEVVSAPQRKRRKTMRTLNNGAPQKPTAPPRCMKTKKGTLTSTISYEAAADLLGAAPETAGTSPPDAGNEADVSDGDEGGRLAAGEGDGSRQVDDSNAHDPPPTSSAEEIGALNLLSLSISAPNTPPPGLPAADDGEDSLFVPEQASPVPTPAPSTRLEDLLRQEAATPPLASRRADEDVNDAAEVAKWSAEDRALYRRFCKDVSTAEERWDHHKTSHAMALLRAREPQLCPTFLRCLAIARKTMGEDVLYEWRKFQEQGWERRRRHDYGVQSAETATPSRSPSAAHPARRDVVAAAYREFQETVKAKTNDWKARFQYRRATVGLTAQCEAYAELREKWPAAGQSSTTQTDRSMLLRALFREMHPDWLNALPCDFTDKQAKDQGYGQDWKAFNRSIQDGRRWKVLVEELGLGALLLIDTSGSVDYIQRQAPIPIFSAWTRLISRVRLDVKEVAARVEGYYDGMEDPSFLSRKLRPLKLERRAYRACSPGEQFEYSGSEGGRTPTADPNSLTRPSDTMGGQMMGQVYGMEDFIDSSGLDDADMLEPPRSAV